MPYERERLTFLEEQGYRVAQQTAELAGNLVRVPISVWNVLNRRPPLSILHLSKPIYQFDEDTLRRAVVEMDRFLRLSLTAFETNQGTAKDRPLRWDLWDAFFTGIYRYNQEGGALPTGASPAVGVDIVLHVLPPALILETGESLAAPLWTAYQRLLSRFTRQLIQRYGYDYSTADHSARVPVAVAIEMFNEPDYVWLPDEAKLEIAINPHAYPCDKYISQLYLSQIPENDLPNKGCTAQNGYYREQDFPKPHEKTALKNFRWGRKFDHYVASFADLHEQVSFAAHDEIRRGMATLAVVSSAVTHVNLDWFRRMFLANPNTFRHVEKIAIHPYHWPRHDIHDFDFVTPHPEKDWTLATPREFTPRVFQTLWLSARVRRACGSARSSPQLWLSRKSYLGNRIWDSNEEAGGRQCHDSKTLEALYF